MIVTVDISEKMGADTAQALLAGTINWKQYDGSRIASNASGGAVYLAMRGQLFAIPDGATFNTVFNNWNNIIISDYLVAEMPRGPALSSGSFTAVSVTSPAQYLVTLGKKLWIPDPATVTRFNFRGPVTIPHLALDYIPTGANVS